MNQNKTIQNIIIAGGGTGGHIFPAIAIANAIKKINPLINFLFVGAKGKMEMQKVPQAGYKIEGLNIAGYNRSSLFKNILLPFKIVKSLLQVSTIFKAFKPDVVIGVGGYSSFPVLRYAQSKNIPTFIHESNSFAGKSNILLGKKATKIFTATEGMEKFFPANNILITGNPVRKNIVEIENTKTEALQFFGLQENKKTVLSVGGSLGAQSINNAIAGGLHRFAENDLQLIWQTGEQFYPVALQLSGGKSNIFVSAFIQQMQMAYTAADVVISRSGAMAVAELCVVKKPTVFVPYPFAAEDHQTANAMALVNKNAAFIVADKNINDELINNVISLVKNEAQQIELKNNIELFAVKDADERIANAILFHHN